MAPDGNSSPSDDGNNVDAGDQSGLLYSSQQRGPSRVQQGSQQHRRGLPGSSREGPPPLASTGWEHQTRPGQHHEQVRSSLGQPQEGLLFSPPRQQQEGAFLFSGQQQERAFSPSEQQQERAFSPTVPARHEPILHERPYSRPGQAQFTSQPSTSANKSRTPQPQGRPQQQQQQPQETVGGTGGLESLMRMARLMPTPAMIASRRMAQSIGSGRVPGQAQNPQSVIIASILGRDVIIEAMSVPADGMNIANVGSSRVAEPGFAGTGGVPGTPGEVLGGGTATAHPSPLHFWEAGQQHGVASVHTDAYRTADQAVASGQGPSVTAAPYNIIDRMDTLDTVQRYREVIHGQQTQQMGRRDARSRTGGGMATLVQPRIIWVERNFELTREPEPNPEYSRKIFIGGFPPQVTSRELEAAFQPFGRVRCHKQADRGHAYVVFENGRRVAEFLSSCRRTEGAEIYAWQAWGTSLQVIPWETSDNQYGERILDLGVDQLNFMVFVGALYGETTAKQLAFVLELTCGPVQFVRIDTDRYQYPTGSARVQFRTYQSFLQALKIHYLEIRAHHYQRTIELNPFVDEGVLCSRCLSNPSVVVCKAATCLKHYCNRCFMEHVTPLTDEHIPVIRREQGP